MKLTIMKITSTLIQSIKIIKKLNNKTKISSKSLFNKEK